MGLSWQRKVITVLGVLACLLQIAAIASPGWMIYVKGNIEEYHSLFYRQTCKTLMLENNCKVESFHELHYDLREKLIDAQVSREKLASVDFEYNNLICKQVLILIAALLSAVMAFSQVVQTIKKKAYPRLTVLSAATAAISAGIVITVVCYDIVHVCYQIDLQKMDSHRDHTYVGFPYCLGMLLGSALFHFFSLSGISSQLHRPKLRIKEKPVYKSTEDTTPYEPPVTRLNEVCKPTFDKGITINDKGNDNPVFSEKL